MGGAGTDEGWQESREEGGGQVEEVRGGGRTGQWGCLLAPELLAKE